MHKIHIFDQKDNAKKNILLTYLPGMGSITFESNILQLQLLCIGPITITITITFENHHPYYNYNYFWNVIYYNYLLLF